VTPKGKRVEGEGVMPDIELKLTQADFAANRDRGLEAAVEFLQQKTVTTKSLASVTESTK
jgi:C-terminal processing protease CtpA/Prc